MSTTAPLGNADRVRGTLGLVFGELVRAGGRLVEHPRLREIYPEYLFTLHTMVRTAVPMLETGRDRARALAPDDPVAAELVDYLQEHVEEERDHDEWLLQDLESIGGAPTVASAVGAQYYWILHVHPVALLGWIALLEGYPPENATIDRMAARTGYPESAFRTLREHAELDIAHGDELFALIDRLPLSEEQATVIGLNAMSSVQLLARALDEITG